MERTPSFCSRMEEGGEVLRYVPPERCYDRATMRAEREGLRRRMDAAHAELVTQQTRRYEVLIQAALPVVRGALGGAIASSVVGYLPAGGGKIALSAAASNLDRETVEAAATTARGAAAAAWNVGKALVGFLLTSQGVPHAVLP